NRGSEARGLAAPAAAASSPTTAAAATGTTATGTTAGTSARTGSGARLGAAGLSPARGRDLVRSGGSGVRAGLGPRTDVGALYVGRARVDVGGGGAAGLREGRLGAGVDDRGRVGIDARSRLRRHVAALNGILAGKGPGVRGPVNGVGIFDEAGAGHARVRHDGHTVFIVVARGRHAARGRGYP